MFADNISFGEQKQMNSWAANHRSILVDKTTKGGVAPRQIKTAEFIDMEALGSECWDLVKKGAINAPPLFHIPGGDLEYTLTCKIATNSPRNGAKKSKTAQLTRRFRVSGDQLYSFSLVPSSESFGYKGSSDMVPNDGEGGFETGANLLAIGSMMGCNLSEMSYSAQCGALSIAARGMDLRHLALKAYLLMCQSILHSTVRDFNMEGLRQKRVIPSVDTPTMLEACTRHSLVIDCASLSSSQALLLTVLVGAWPPIRLVRGEEVDIYSSITLADEGAYLYSSSVADITVDTHPNFGSADDVIMLITGLFSALHAMDQLLEVFRESKGLAGVLIKVASSTKRNRLRMSLKYPLSRGCNRVGFGGTNKVEISQASHFLMSSSHLILDLLMSEQAYNRLHCIGERLGLYNDRVYANLRSARVSGMLRDQGYVQYTENSQILVDVAPWMGCLNMVGTHMCEWLIEHSLKVRGTRNGSIKDNDMNLTLPLLIYDEKVIRLSSHAAMVSNVDINPDYILTPYVDIMEMSKARKSINWLHAAGFGNDGFAYDGLSHVGMQDIPDIGDDTRIICDDLDGLYKIQHTTISLKGITVSRDPRARHAHFFRNKHLLMASSITEPMANPRSSTTRLYRTSSGARMRDETFDRGDDPQDEQSVETPEESETSMTTEPEKTEGVTIPKFSTGHEQFCLPRCAIENVPGDGSCALHVVSRYLSKKGINKTVDDLTADIGLNGLPKGFNFTTEGMAIVANKQNCGLIVVNEMDKNVLSYYPEHKDKIYTLYQGVAPESGEAGHFQLLIPNPPQGTSKILEEDSLYGMNVEIEYRDAIVSMFRSEILQRGKEYRKQLESIPNEHIQELVRLAKEKNYQAELKLKQEREARINKSKNKQLGQEEKKVAGTKTPQKLIRIPSAEAKILSELKDSIHEVNKQHSTQE